MNTEHQVDRVVDTFGLLCPIPIIKAAAALKEMADGEMLQLISTDAGVVKDMQDWCRANGHEYVADHQSGRIFNVWVRKRGRI